MMKNQRALVGLSTLLGCVVIPLVAHSYAGAQAGQDKPPTPPRGLPPVIWPDDNPYSKAKAELGLLLYFDKRLSSDNSVACASCHAPEKGYTDGAPVSTGIKSQKGGRSAPTVINRAYSLFQFWDGRAATLEEQAKGPVANSIEMTLEPNADAAHRALVAKIGAIRGYQPLFRSAFGSPTVDMDRIAKAIATYERTVLSGDSPFDRYQDGDKKAMNESQINGMKVFYGKAACDACHLGFNFTDGSYVNVGVGWDKPNPDPGRFNVSKRKEDTGAFKTPTLREIALTAPYMHDGSLATLEAVVEHYDKGGIKNPYLDQRMKPLKLTVQEKTDLVSFLKALSGRGWQHIKAPTSFPK